MLSHFPNRVRTRLAAHRVVKQQVLDRYRRRGIQRDLEPFPTDATVPMHEAEDVLLLCSGYLERFHLQSYVQELAFAHELAARGRAFAVTDEPREIFDKRVAWFLPGTFVRPRLWDYSRQAYEFARGLEDQGNNVFCSSSETAYWENKAHMHAMFERHDIPTPQMLLITRQNRADAAIDFAPVLVKEEHSAGSAGLHFFPSATEARRFIDQYPLRPGETLIVQALVRGATRDMRLTMAGSAAIRSATYWRQKSAKAVADPNWTPTATKHGSTVVHADPPDGVVSIVAGYLDALGVRTAGVDLIWVDDDVERPPLVLELSPYYQPNPPKPDRYADWSYREFKQRSHVPQGYLSGQYGCFREVAAQLMEQGLF
jgi:glutathione synthase/RimK-type ligase-like ATP-grasp enzyme